MSEAYQEMISLDKEIRDMIGKTMYPVKIWCDNLTALRCTQMEGSHKLKYFDENLDVIHENLQDREKTGVKNKMSANHGIWLNFALQKEK